MLNALRVFISMLNIGKHLVELGCVALVCLSLASLSFKLLLQSLHFLLENLNLRSLIVLNCSQRRLDSSPLLLKNLRLVLSLPKIPVNAFNLIKTHFSLHRELVKQSLSFLRRVFLFWEGCSSSLYFLKSHYSLAVLLIREILFIHRCHLPKAIFHFSFISRNWSIE